METERPNTRKISQFSDEFGFEIPITFAERLGSPKVQESLDFASCSTDCASASLSKNRSKPLRRKKKSDWIRTDPMAEENNYQALCSGRMGVHYSLGLPAVAVSRLLASLRAVRWLAGVAPSLSNCGNVPSQDLASLIVLAFHYICSQPL